MPNIRNIESHTDTIAATLRKKGAAEVALKTKKRRLERRELELVSANPPMGKNEEARKIEKAAMLANDPEYAELSDEIFGLEVGIAELEIEISALEKQYSGMRWAIRSQIIDRLRWSEVEYETNIEYHIDTTLLLDEAPVIKEKSLREKGEEELDRFFSEIPVAKPPRPHALDRIANQESEDDGFFNSDDIPF